MQDVYVYLLHEGTNVWVPFEAEELGDGMYRLLRRKPYRPQEDIDGDEEWEFAPGDIVRCQIQRLNGRDCLVAVSRAD